MEFILWALIFIVFFVVVKALRFEKTSRVYHEKELIKRYFEIKSIDVDYRRKYLAEWEVQAKSSIEKNEKPQLHNVVDLGSFRAIK